MRVIISPHNWIGFVSMTALVCALAAGIGAFSALTRGVGGIPGLAAAGALMLAVVVHRWPSLFLQSLALLLTGYAFLGKGFAYVGVPPLFIGEAVLGLAVLTVIVTMHRARFGLLHALIIGFMCWGLVRTVPYIAYNGMDALRDAVLWGYAVFALAVSFVLSASHFRWLTSWYRRMIPWFVCWVPIAASAYFLFPAAIPMVPSSGVPLLWFKGGDMAVHLAGISAFVLVGLYSGSPKGRRVPELLLWPAWFSAVAVAGALNRGGLIAVCSLVAVAFVLRPSRQWLRFVGVMVVLVTTLLLANPEIDIRDGQARTISPQQLVRNVVSVVSATEEGNLNDTKEWRLEWWQAIVSYTVHGSYFWTGKGFGVNLATDDGFQVLADESLRSPHNSHMSVLARMGVPGLVLWIMLHAAFGGSLLRAYKRARNSGQVFWAQVNAWVLLYWLAMLVDANFDVYLESPQGGIWLWSVMGFGLAALRLQATEAKSGGIAVHNLNSWDSGAADSRPKQHAY